MALEHVDPLVDLMVLRPFGLVALAVGTLIFVIPVAPIALLSRPEGLHLAFERLVVNPARYVWADPLGSH